MSKYTKDIGPLRGAIEALQQKNPIIPEDFRFNDVLRECVKLLETQKYVVKAPPKAVGVIKNTRGLIGQFYNILAFKHPATVPYMNEKADLKIAKDFVNKVMELTSLEYTLAIGFASKLIDIVFMHEHEFSFEPGTLHSFRIFGQDKMSWITEKAIRIYNRELEDEDAQNRRASAEIEQYEKTHDVKFGYGSNEEIQKLIDNLKED